MWWENAVIYGISPKVFYDGDNDGVGDFTGLTEKLDYLKNLGVTCLWLLPFYPSGDRDDGYDVTEYCNVDPRLGTLDDFDRFIIEAKKKTDTCHY